VGTSILPRAISNGRAIWGAHAVWAGVLQDWQTARGDDSWWHGIDFDTFAHCIHLIWNALHAKEEVSFACPYQSSNGVHGPGLAVPKRGSDDLHVFVLDAISHIQEALNKNPDVSLLGLKTEQWRGKKQYFVKPGRERTCLAYHLSDLVGSGFSQNDAKYIKALSSVLAVWTQDEIRALGTHQTKDGTIEAIEYNVYIHLFLRLIDLTLDLAGTPRKRKGTLLRQADLPSLDTVIEEIGRKSHSNRSMYAGARVKLASHVDCDARAVAGLALAIFQSPESIWDSAEVKAWHAIYEKLVELLAYTDALSAAFLPPSEPEDEAAKIEMSRKCEDAHRRGSAARERLAGWFGAQLPLLPRQADRAFPWEALRGAIVRILDALPGVTAYRQRYEKVAARYRSAF